MASDTTCVRISPEDRAQIEAYCMHHGLTISDFARLAFRNLIGAFSDGVTEGYKEGRAMAAHVAFAVLRQALAGMPESYTEAVERYGIPGTE